MKIDLAKAIDKILTEYGDEVKETLNKELAEVADDTVKYLKANSPKGNGKRHYASGWTDDVETAWHGTTLTIYNKTKPQLTHLLNNGHHYVTRAGVRLFDVKGDGHIDKAEEYANDLLIRKVESKL